MRFVSTTIVFALSTACLGAQQPCSSDTREDCLYRPLTSYEFEPPIVRELRDPTRVGQPGRTFSIAIRKPIGAPEPWPIVITSHGGSSGKSNPIKALRRWAEFAAERGFLSIAIAHPLRSRSEGQILCEQLGATENQCNNFKYNNYDRPLDLARTIDELEHFATSDEWKERLDLDKIVYLGHSAGAGATQMVNGACRSYYSDHVGDEMFCAKDDRPAAFVSLSPQGIDDDGFKEGSWTTMSRPYLMATGRGDGGVEVGPNRRDGFYGSSAERQFLFYIDHPGAVHGLFGENQNNACRRETRDAALCESFDRALRSTVAAFLDAVRGSDRPARKWLRSDRIVIAGEPHIVWQHR